MTAKKLIVKKIIIILLAGRNNPTATDDRFSYRSDKNDRQNHRIFYIKIVGTVAQIVFEIWGGGGCNSGQQKRKKTVHAQVPMYKYVKS